MHDFLNRPNISRTNKSSTLLAVLSCKNIYFFQPANILFMQISKISKNKYENLSKWVLTSRFFQPHQFFLTFYLWGKILPVPTTEGA